MRQSITSALAALMLLAGAAACSGTSSSAPTGLAPATATSADTEQIDARHRRSPGATSAPSAAPSTLPSSSSGATTFTNGVEYATTWRPFAPDSPWNTPVSSHPTQLANSDAIVATEFGGGNTQAVRSYEAGPYDYAYAVVYATANDPQVTLACSDYCDRADHGGLPATIRIPAAARPPGHGGAGCSDCYEDAPLAIIQPDGTEIDTAYGQQPSGDWGTGGNTTLHVGAAASCGNWTSASGFYGTATGATAGGNCLSAGLLRANELLAGHINHALKLISQCAVGNQYPAFSGASTSTCGSGQGAPLGARLWYDVPDATTDANANLHPWEKAILDALHDYGGYLLDNSCPNGDAPGACAHQSGIQFMVESGEPFADFGQPTPYAALASQGWYALSVPGASQARWVGADPWNPAGVDWSHFHWLAACSAQGSC